MPKQSKFFRVAVEGDTCDGREILRQDILDMVATYSRDTYGARINCEHLRGLMPDGPFGAYGDVMEVKAEDYTFPLGGKSVTKLAMYARIEPTNELLALNAKKQKVYTSIEINPKFAKTNKAYLMGLGITDSPASLGTEYLQFCAQQGEKSPLAGRKQDPGNFFSTGIETELEFEDAPANDNSTGDYKSMFAAATEFFKNFGKPPVQPPVQEPPKEQTPPANDNDVRFAQLVEGMGKMTAGIEALSTRVGADVAALKGEIATVKASIDTTDKHQDDRRPKGTGGHNYTLADC